MAGTIESASAGYWLCCRAGVHSCALPVESVVEVMRLQPVETLAGVPEFIRGLSIVRGLTVPVVDMGLLLSGEAVEGRRLVTIRAEARLVGLAVDQVIGVRSLQTVESNDLPPLTREAANGVISCVGALDAALLLLLRTARVIPEPLLETLLAGRNGS